jgi:radical SAM-linked protein
VGPVIGSTGGGSSDGPEPDGTPWGTVAAPSSDTGGTGSSTCRRLAEVEEATTPASRAAAGQLRDARQRWRLAFRRSPAAPALAQRDATAAWEQAVLASGLPVVVSAGDRPRPRLVFAAALPAGAAAERDLADLFLHERRPAWDVRERLTGVLPEGVELVDLHDVWLGEAPLPGVVTAADWRVVLEDGPSPPELRDAALALLAADSLPRNRIRSGSAAAYDLRPLLDDIAVEDATPPTLRIRTLFHMERGVGRPDEVVAELADQAGLALAVRSLIRTGLVLAPPKSDRADPGRRSGRAGPPGGGGRPSS